MRSHLLRMSLLFLLALGIGVGWLSRDQFAPEFVADGLERLGLWGRQEYIEEVPLGQARPHNRAGKTKGQFSLSPL